MGSDGTASSGDQNSVYILMGFLNTEKFKNEKTTQVFLPPLLDTGEYTSLSQYFTVSFTSLLAFAKKITDFCFSWQLV